MAKVRRQPLKFDLSELLDRLEREYGRHRFIARFDPLEELICCILSQSSSDSSSFPAFTRLRAAYPDWADMEAAPPDGIKALIASAGLANQKTKAIQGTLQMIRERFGEHSLAELRGWPLMEAREWLMTLPGVGLKTASIVLCFSFGRDAIPVDTHVHRVGQRLQIIPKSQDANRAHDGLLKTVPEGEAYRFHALLIQHGRKCCTARSPRCGDCPIQDLCPWKGKPL